MTQFYMLKSKNEFGVDVVEAYSSTVERLKTFVEEEGVSGFEIVDQDGSLIFGEIAL